jgi:hypothetical protein
MEEICGLTPKFAVAFGDVIQRGPETGLGRRSLADGGKWEQPRNAFRILSVESTSNGDGELYLSISPDWRPLWEDLQSMEGSEEQHLVPRLAWPNADILMHVEMPVTIILGCTTMLLKDLLKLTDGSVVELDQMLDEEVEVGQQLTPTAKLWRWTATMRFAFCGWRPLKMATLDGNCLKKQPKPMHPQYLRMNAPRRFSHLKTFVAKSLYKRRVVAIYKEQCNEDRE